MANERITENLFRELLRANHYFDSDNGIVIEEQKSQIKSVQKLLKTASKSKTGKGGYPEFIISWDKDQLKIVCPSTQKVNTFSTRLRQGKRMNML